MATKSDIQKKGMIQALEKSLGVVTTAAKSAGVSRDTHYRWLKEDQEYRAAVEGIEGIALDLAESKLHQEIIGGNTACIIFFLKTKGKRRGYVEKQEIDMTTKQPDLSELSTQEIIELLNEN
jgi:hypothetical protein